MYGDDTVIIRFRMDSTLGNVMTLAGSVLELPLHLAHIAVMLNFKTEEGSILLSMCQIIDSTS